MATDKEAIGRAHAGDIKHIGIHHKGLVGTQRSGRARIRQCQVCAAKVISANTATIRDQGTGIHVAQIRSHVPWRYRIVKCQGGGTRAGTVVDVLVLAVQIHLDAGNTSHVNDFTKRHINCDDLARHISAIRRRGTDTGHRRNRHIGRGKIQGGAVGNTGIRLTVHILKGGSVDFYVITGVWLKVIREGDGHRGGARPGYLAGADIDGFNQAVIG